MVAVRIEGPLKPLRDVTAPLVIRTGSGNRRMPTAHTRAADEEQLGVAISAKLIELRPQLIDECRVHAPFGKRLPFDKHRVPAKSRKIRRPHEIPLRSSPHIDQNSFRVCLEARPYAVDWHVIHYLIGGRRHLLSPNKPNRS